MKICIKCQKEKDISEFAIKRGKPSGTCRECHNAYQREYYNDPEKGEKHRQRLRERAPQKRAAKYGLSVESVEFIFACNSGMCELCNKREATCIDHDHETGRVRGVLCQACNTGLGKLGDTVESLEKAIRYLKGLNTREHKPGGSIGPVL